MRMMRIMGKTVFLACIAIGLLASVSAGADTLVLPADMKTLEEEAFYGDTSIGRVVLPEGIETIGPRAFANSSLTTVNLPESISYIAASAFEGLPIESVTIIAKESSYGYEFAHKNGFRIVQPMPEIVESSSWEEFAGITASLIQDAEVDAVSEEYADYVTGRLIVKAEEALPDVSGFGIDAIVRDPEDHYVIQFGNAKDASECAEYLNSDDGVVYAEPDFIVCAEGVPADGVQTESYSWGVSATYADAYAADLIARNKTGQITVAVVDTGIDSGHAMFGGRLVQGYDFIEDDDVPEDGYSHGTHVSGIIVDCTPNLNVRIMPVRVLGDDGHGTMLTIAQGIRYAADHGADVINLSLSGGHTSYVDEEVRYAAAKGVTVVAAAGNQESYVDYRCPAHMSECITVAAVDSSLDRAYFSNYGSAVDIAAPGVSIVSAIPGGGYMSKNGTSMAAPHVSAAAAMLLMDYPGSSVSNLLKNAATDLGSPGWDQYYGAGFLDLRPFIQTAELISANLQVMYPYYVGMEFDLQLTDMQPSYARYRWESGDSSVVSVTPEGHLKVLSPGTAALSLISGTKEYSLTFRVPEVFSVAYYPRGISSGHVPVPKAITWEIPPQPHGGSEEGVMILDPGEYLTVMGVGEWTAQVISGSDWLTLKTASGTVWFMNSDEETYLSTSDLYTMAEPGTESRTAEILFTLGDYQWVYTVVQEAAAAGNAVQ